MKKKVFDSPSKKIFLMIKILGIFFIGETIMSFIFFPFALRFIMNDSLSLSFGVLLIPPLVSSVLIAKKINDSLPAKILYGILSFLLGFICLGAAVLPSVLIFF